MITAVLLSLALAANEPSESVESFAQRAFESNKAGRYQEALKYYLRAYELTPLPSILYNVAVLYDRRLKDPSLAMDFYRRYVAAPDAEPELTKKASLRLEQLQQDQRSRVLVPVDDSAAAAAVPVPAAPKPGPTVVTPAQPSAPAPTVAAAVTPASNTGRWVAVGLGVLAVGSVATGTVFGVRAMQFNDQAKAFCGATTCSDPKGITLTNQALSSATVANVTIGVGAGLAVAAVLVGVLSRPPETTVSFAPLPGGGALVLGGAL